MRGIVDRIWCRIPPQGHFLAAKRYVHEVESALYNQIFFTNVLRLLDEHGLTKSELADAAGISESFLSDLTNGKANPSLKIMEARRGK